jgi:hypothetical protein
MRGADNRVMKNVNHLASVLKHSLTKKSVAATAAVVCSVGGLGGIAYAITAGPPSSPAVSASATVPPTTQPGSTQQGSSPSAGPSSNSRSAKGKALGRLLKILSRAVHGEVVIPAAGGGFRTVDFDKGSITSISSSSITISSLDGGSPVTANITSTTREPKAGLTQGQTVVLLSSNGDAVAIRPLRTGAAAQPGAGTGSGQTGTQPLTAS